MSIMEWQGEGVVLRVRPQGKGAYLLCLFSREFGKLSGFVSGSQKLRHELQLGNVLEFTHIRRLENQLGSFYVDLVHAPSAQKFNEEAYLYILQYLGDLHEKLLAEHQPLPTLYDAFQNLLRFQGESRFLWQSLAVYEVSLLKALGYGLSLEDAYAVRGEEDQTPLVYVSPKSGRAVSKQMGAPFHDKMLRLPKLFGGESHEMLDLFKLTGHFLRVACDGEELSSRRNLIRMAQELNFGEK